MSIPDCVYTESLYWTYGIHLTLHTESIGLLLLCILVPDRIDDYLMSTESLYWTYGIHLTLHTESIGLLILAFISDIGNL